MKQLLFLLSFAVAALAPSAAFCDCPVTLPSSSPVELPAAKGTGWYGSDALAVLLRSDGKWTSTRPDRNYGDKLWFWRRGYDAWTEIRPDLVLAGVKLDGGDAAQRVHINNATNATTESRSWSRMLVGMEFPSAGCWQITAIYKYIEITHDLTFVVEVVADR
jgi:hypothetical protein